MPDRARLRVNFFSPLPPASTEIANHTLALLPTLAARSDLRVWTAQPDAAPLPDGMALVPFDPETLEWARIHDADVNVFNLGNHHGFHGAIFEVARQVPGIVILHDTRLQHFFGGYLTSEGERRELYRHMLGGLYGDPALARADRYLRGELPFDDLVARYPMTLAAVDRALAAVVHNPAELAGLAQNALLPAVHIPLAGLAGPAPVRPAQSDALRLIMCGYIGGNRRLPQILQAIAAVPDAGLHLDVFGKLEEPEAAAAQIAQLGLRDRVTLHGFVPAAVLDAALARADLAINLRYPSMGEASASQLRMWAFALPTLVTRTGWYATLPADIVTHIDPGQEVTMIGDALRALRRDRKRFAAAGQRGRARLEREHTPEAYAAALLELCGQHRALHARLHATELARRASNHAMQLVQGVAAHRMAPRLAGVIHELTAPPA